MKENARRNGPAKVRRDKKRTRDHDAVRKRMQRVTDHDRPHSADPERAVYRLLAAVAVVMQIEKLLKRKKQHAGCP